MRRLQDRIGSFRLWRSLLGVSALVLLSGCGWFGGGNNLNSQKVRPGADRNVAGSGALPSANPGRQYEPGFAATDETRTPQVGSIVAAKGGQKAQKEAADKEAAERDAKDREAREKREAAEREAKAKDKEKEKESPPAKPMPNGLPGRPAAAELGNADSSKTTPKAAPGTTPAAPQHCDGNAARDRGAAACACHVDSRAAADRSACRARAGTAGAVAHVTAAA